MAGEKPAKEGKSAPAAAGQAAAAGVKPGAEMTEAQKTGLAEVQKMYEENAGAGFEEAGANAYAIPFLYILQSGSPQCKRSDPAYIPGAEEGMLLNTVTGQIIEARVSAQSPNVGALFVPAHYAARYIEWKPRESGGGFVQEHPPTTPLAGQTTKDEKNRDKLANGNNLVDTRNHYGIIIGALNLEGQPVPDFEPQPIVVSMSSTQVKKSRNWMSKMSAQKIRVGTTFKSAPMFGYIWRLQTVPEKNDQGSWYGWRVEAFGPVTDPALFTAAKEFRDAVVAGRAQAVQPLDERVVNDDIDA